MRRRATHLTLAAASLSTLTAGLTVPLVAEPSLAAPTAAASGVAARTATGVAAGESAPVVTAVAVRAGADAVVRQRQPTVAGGRSAVLATSGRPGVRSYLTFPLPPAPDGQVLLSAALRLRTTAGAAAGSRDDQVIRVAAGGWDEPTVTWATRPSAAGITLGSLRGATAASQTYATRLNAAVVGRSLGGPFSIGMLGTGSDALTIASREAADWRARPALVLRFGPASATLPSPAPAPAPTALAPAPAPAAAPPAPAAPAPATPATASAAPAAAPAAPAPPAPAVPAAPAAPAPAAPAPAAPAAPAPAPAAPAPAAPAAAPRNVGPVTVVAVGDIACRPGFVGPANSCKHGQVADVVRSANPDWFLPLGDIQYDVASVNEFYGPGGYHDTFGSLKPRTLPALGNHEYLDEGPANGYWDYFGQGVAPGTFGNRGEGWYTRTVGSWRLIVLNSECAPDNANGRRYLPSGCAEGSPQYTWLERTLKASQEKCTVVTFHRPRWTTGAHQPYGEFFPIWDLLARHKVDVTLSGHNHSSEVFHWIGVSGPGPVPTRSDTGIRSFVAGGGGRDQRPFPNPVTSALQSRDSTTFGPLRLVLKDGSYDWDYMPIPGQAFKGDGTPTEFSARNEQCR